jgi:hypothetical protein
LAGEALLGQLGSQDTGRQWSTDAAVAPQGGEAESLARKVMRDIEKSAGQVEAWRAPAKEDYRYYAGNQWSDLDRMKLEQQKRPALVFNEIGDKIDALSGLERINRTDIRFVSRAPDSDLIHDAAGDLATDAVAAVLDIGNGPYETSRLAKDVAIGGMGWGEVAMSFDDDIDGRVTFNQHNPFEFSWDTQAERDNLEDTDWRARIRDFPRKKFEDRWPDKLALVEASAPSYPENQLTKYELVTPYYSKANERANPEVGQQNAPRKNIQVIQYQWKDHVTIYRIPDPNTPDGLMELSEQQYRDLKAKAELIGAPTPVAARQLKTVFKQVYVASGVQLEDPVTLPNGFSLLCCTGQWDSEKKVWYGIVRALKDPQNTMNKAISSLVTQFITNVKGGVIYRAGAFTDPNQAKAQWAQPDAFIEASQTANLAADILQRVPSNTSPAPPLLFQESKAAISRQSGINEEMLGFGTGDVGAPAIGKRIQSALAILGWFFDNLERFRRTQAVTLLEFIREYWSYGQLVRVGGDFNSKAIPLIKSDLPNKYDLVVDQSVKYNANLKQQIWQDLIQIAGPLMKTPIGQQFLLKAMKYSPLPTQLVAELQELAQQAAQQPPKQGRGGKQPDPPELVQARVLKMNADAQKAIAEAKNLDKRSGLDLAKMVTDTTLRGQELRHKQAMLEKKAVMDRLRAQQVGGTPNGGGPFGGQPPAA